MKTCPCNIQRFLQKKKIEKLIGFFFYFLNIFDQNIHCGYRLEAPHRGGSNEYPQSMFLSKQIRKIGIPLHTPGLLYKSGV